MSTPSEYLDFGKRERWTGAAQFAYPPPERCATACSGGVQDCQRYGYGGIASKALLCRRAVKLDHSCVDRGLVGDFQSVQGRTDDRPNSVERGLNAITTEFVAPSRRSTASRWPRDAPAGAIARPIRPFSS